MRNYMTYGVCGAQTWEVARNFRILRLAARRFAEHHGTTLRFSVRNFTQNHHPRRWRAGFSFREEDIVDAALLCTKFEKDMRDRRLDFFLDARTGK